jgi:hypothetical protein
VKRHKHKPPDEPKTKPTRQTLEELQHAADIAEKLTVLRQPHRRGDEGDMACVLGTFVRHQCVTKLADGRTIVDRRCYDGGKLYKLLVAKWRRAKGIPQPEVIDEEGVHGGGELLKGTVDDWLERIKACENAMKCSGLPGFRSANNMILYEIPPPEEQYGPVKRAIFQLAICLGLYPN